MDQNQSIIFYMNHPAVLYINGIF